MILSTQYAPAYLKGLSHLKRRETVHSWKTLAELVSRVDSAWSPILWEGGRRKSEFFESAEAVVLDIDDGFTITEAKKLLDELGYMYLIGTTKSHQKIKHEGTPKEQPACDRYRIVIPAATACTNIDDYKFSCEQLGKIFKGDDSVNDGARYFFRCSEITDVKESGKKFTWMKAKHERREAGDKPKPRVTGRLSQLAMKVLFNEWEKEPRESRHKTLFHTAASMRRFGMEDDQIHETLATTDLYKELMEEDGNEEIIRTINNAITAKED